MIRLLPFCGLTESIHKKDSYASKNSTIVTTRARKRWGRKRGWRESRSSPAQLSNMLFRQSKRRNTSASDVVDGEISDVLAGNPCLTPVCRALLHTGFPPSSCLLSHPPYLFG